MMTSFPRLTRAALPALLCVAVLTPRAAFAQSLGDVARKSEQQRQSGTSKVYTNENLDAVDPPAAPPVNPAAAPTDQTPAPEAPKPSGLVVEENAATGHTNLKSPPGADRRDEQYWRKMIGDVRAKMAKLNGEIATQQARLDQIEGETPTAVREREVMSGTIERLQKDVGLQTQELARWMARAATAKVPEEWTR